MQLDRPASADMTKRALPGFPSSKWTYVLKLLGLMIVADKRVLKVEVDTFLDVVMELRVVMDPSVTLTRHMARDWFVLNRPDLESVIESLAYDTFICETLAPIKSIPHKLDIISGMVRIAISDDDYVQIERGLIKKTCLYWNIGTRLQETVNQNFVPEFQH